MSEKETQMLVIMRHGEAQATPGSSGDRALIAAGRAEASEKFAKMFTNNPVFDHVYCSTKLRARETLDETFHSMKHGKIIYTEMLKPSGDPVKVADELRELTGNTLVVSHLPLVELLVDELCGAGSCKGFGYSDIYVLKKGEDGSFSVERSSLD